jgi:hypothetical protein
MKSLAHPEWPYEGTPHEWRGFVKRTPVVRTMTYEEFEAFINDKPKPLGDVPKAPEALHQGVVQRAAGLGELLRR